ncbi:hypothetical protein PtA15_3A366 [Puccinia triticina]|uniref:Uncharacterized protein n=1 Tax=Puccinia triticina TaxID=208348 RepID=A0ABY7CGN7_9BASI|nr:uncharacterized protein PtA15_3A366 [Puccinia triticina]WAQ83000.1 hypothetical protein PtA15_3A366 [Puccinia triticina]
MVKEQVVDFVLHTLSHSMAFSFLDRKNTKLREFFILEPLHLFIRQSSNNGVFATVAAHGAL